MLKKKNVLIAMILFIIMGLTACTGNKASDGNLVVANVNDATTLDLQASNDQPSSRVFSHIYESLVSFDENMEIQPKIAESWEQLDDLNWEFKIKEGVKFHNGENLDAKDVKFSLDRHRESPEVGHLLKNIDSVEVIDDYKVLIKTKKPFAALLAHLSHYSTGIINEKAVNEAGESFGQEPVGTGPYELEVWNIGDNIVLKRFEDYHGTPAKMEKITFNVIPEATNRVIALETGEVHIAYDIDPVDKQRVMESDELEFIEEPSFSLQYMGMNTRKKPFDNKKVRQAINYAINKEEIIKYVLEGAGERANTTLQYNIPGSNKDLKGYDYDLEKAKSLMKEAGYEDGFKTEIMTNDSPVRGRIAELIQDQLKEININLDIQALEWGSYLDKTSRGEHEMYMLGWSPSTGDADYGLGSLFHSDNIGAAGNRSYYESKEVDDLLDKAAAEKDRDLRNKFYEDAQVIIMDDAPMVPIYFDSNTAGILKSVKDFRIQPTGNILLDKVYIEE